MDFFREFSSNSIAGSGNQLFFTSDPMISHTGRIFYRITQGGNFRYSLLFSNTMDSTFADGSISRAGIPCPAWHILSARAAACKSPDPNILQDVDFRILTFGGREEKQVASGEIFHCDAFPMDFASGDYLCLELTFRGAQIPYHEETLLPVYRKTENGWSACKHMPFPGRIGCDRPVKGRIAFLGDSITQGIGTEPNSYAHWNALIAHKLPDFACWNLGLGYGRASDMALDSSWMCKAKQNDFAVVCFGVNDILQGRSAAQLTADLETIVSGLQGAGVKVLLQTVPPFDYSAQHKNIWETVNQYIREVLARQGSLVFDVVPVLGCQGASHMAKYGGHPDAAGCKVWAKALLPYMKEFLQTKVCI